MSEITREQLHAYLDDAPSNTTPSPQGNSAAEAAAGGLSEAGGSEVATSAPNMIGDFGIGAFARLQSASHTATPIASRYAGIKIAENESPRPLTRVFFTYNYFSDVSTFPIGSQVASASSFNLHRELFGFEYAFLDGNASVGMRLPVLQRDGIAGGNIDGVGDLTTIFKYAFINDTHSGDVVSGGLAVTVPTGRDIILADGHHLNSVLLQPWGGFILNTGNCYALGFTSLILPTDSRDVTFYAADIGVGYRLYQDCNNDAFLTQVIPTLEAHANIPLNHNGFSSTGDIFFPNQFVLTGGLHIGLCNTAFLTVGVATPISGPRPYDFEILTQFNIRF